MSDQPIHLVLDTTAIVAFTAGSVAVGELLSELADEHAAAALPVLCLAEALDLAVEREHLDLLVQHPATALWGVLDIEWQPLGHMQSAVGDLASAQAILTAVDTGAAVLTARPERYAGIADGTFAIGMEE